MRKDVRRSRRGSSVRQWVLLTLAIAALLALAPVLAHAQAPADSVTLVWTAPGDDGTIGTATNYEMRFSFAPIDLTNWDQAFIVPGMPSPLLAGNRQRVTVRGLDRGNNYYFAMRAQDDIGNWSGLSNVAHWDWVVDTAPPASPSGFVAAREGTSHVLTQWQANAEPDLAGYNVYRATSQSGPYSKITGAPTTSTQYLDTTIPAGTDMAWYQVSASDVTGNESARTAALGVSMVDAAVVNWRLDACYPNPSRMGSPVHIPMLIASGGASSAVLEINDSGGHRVWRRELGSLSSGPYTLDWDGKNDVGRDVAPGVYTAWLTAGGTRFNVKLVRVP